MSDTNEIGGRIARILTESVLREQVGPLTPETSLVEGGLNLDSVALLELIVAVEEAFGVCIEDEELSVDLVASIGSLATFVRRKLEGAPGSTETPSRPEVGA
jgi:acyl carrier protein